MNRKLRSAKQADRIGGKSGEETIGGTESKEGRRGD